MTDETAARAVAAVEELFFAVALLQGEEEEVGAGGMMTLPPMLDWRIFLA